MCKEKSATILQLSAAIENYLKKKTDWVQLNSSTNLYPNPIAMAIDYIIGGLMLSSAAVNVLALGAFWISPGLRTTANRFVINLLVVNVVACIALVPALCINGGLKTAFHSSYDGEGNADSIVSATGTSRLVIDEPQFNLKVQPIHLRYGHNLPRSHHPLEEGIIDRNTLLQSIESAIIERETGVVRVTHPDCHRFWGFDLAATLGKHFVCTNSPLAVRASHSKQPFYQSISRPEEFKNLSRKQQLPESDHVHVFSTPLFIDRLWRLQSVFNWNWLKRKRHMNMNETMRQWITLPFSVSNDAGARVARAPNAVRFVVCFCIYLQANIETERLWTPYDLYTVPFKRLATPIELTPTKKRIVKHRKNSPVIAPVGCLLKQ